MNFKKVIFELSRKGFVPKKHLGQNFLLDKNIADFIVRVADVEDKNVLEIGGGLGILTLPLANVARNLVVIEKDRTLFEFLREKFAPFSNVEILLGDIMEVDLKSLFRGEEYSIVSNLPYSITSPLLFKLWDEEPKVVRVVIMIQYDVALRLLGKNKRDRSPLFVLYSLTHDVRFLKKVPSGVFWPRPKVDSAIVELTFKEKVDDELKPILRKIVDSAYRYRRKVIEKALSMDMDDIDWRSVLLAVNIDPTLRAEDLLPRDYLSIALHLKICLNRN
ncbi:MAG: 16S rRNA (adenine(1518)-N(6)/adenine(1519)-N(6))-dimethyltransferase RsmA [Thermosulfidibacteraceae bacterium]|jgi:16S rRNA (adenine1518-N6/adenine1519-N6)-dimethyltransferase